MPTVGLASHVTDFSGLFTYGLNGLGKGDEHPAYTSLSRCLHDAIVAGDTAIHPVQGLIFYWTTP